MEKVLVFKTSVRKKKEIRRLRLTLNKLVPKNDTWNFDLEDCDKILRVETQNLQAGTIVSALQVKGFLCEEL